MFILRWLRKYDFSVSTNSNSSFQPLWVICLCSIPAEPTHTFPHVSDSLMTTLHYSWLFNETCPDCALMLLSFQDTDDEDSFHDIEIGILLVEHEGASPSSSLHRSPASLKIILEGQVVIDNIQDLPKAISVWSYIRTASQLPQDYDAHIPVHPKGSSHVGPRWTKAKVANIEEPAYNVKKCTDTCYCCSAATSDIIMFSTVRWLSLSGVWFFTHILLNVVGSNSCLCLSSGWRGYLSIKTLEYLNVLFHVFLSIQFW